MRGEWNGLQVYSLKIIFMHVTCIVLAHQLQYDVHTFF